MTWLTTLFSPNGFLFHLIGIVALTVLLAVGAPSGAAYVGAEWGALLTLLGITVGTGSVTLASQTSTSPPKETPAP